MPYWASAQTPYWDPAARGVLFGLAGHHGKEHMFRALMEGIAFEQRLAFEGMEEGLGQPIDVLLTTGGGSRSALWRQILADVTRKKVVACREAETTSLGAGIHAAAAVGWHGSLLEAADAMTGTGARHTPTRPRRRATTNCSRSIARYTRARLRFTGRCRARSRASCVIG